MAEQYLDGGALFHDCSIAQKCYMDIGQKENTGFKFYKVSRLRVQDLQIQLLPGRWPIWELLLCTELLCQVLTLPLWEVWKVTVQKSACAGRLLLSSPSHVSGSTVSAGLQPSGANGSWELTLSFVVRRKVIWNISNVSVCCWGFIWVSISGFTLRGWFLGGRDFGFYSSTVQNCFCSCWRLREPFMLSSQRCCSFPGIFLQV